IPYHLLTAGACYARLMSGKPVALQAGDVILFPSGDRHVLAAATPAALSLPPVEITGNSLHELLTRGEVEPLKAGARGSATRIVCGFLACDAQLAAPIISSLPRMLRVRLKGSGNASWVMNSIQFSVAESAARRPGSAMVLARLSEVLFAEALRQHMDDQPTQRTGWLGALKDRFVGKALAHMHEQPAADWTVEELARCVGLSRSALGERFVRLVGMPPMQYLLRWRISLAAAQLRQSDASVRKVAADAGYESEAAFIRVFKKEFGAPPSAWRRQTGSRA
ncbi:MAG: AraC family transcriptional regulator, partial [Sinobacteraceae bacterium]|nr:AraC family transcriptional regulator [Nevskiaceae bacterium]